MPGKAAEQAPLYKAVEGRLGHNTEVLREAFPPHDRPAPDQSDRPRPWYLEPARSRQRAPTDPLVWRHVPAGVHRRLVAGTVARPRGTPARRERPGLRRSDLLLRARRG